LNESDRPNLTRSQVEGITASGFLGSDTTSPAVRQVFGISGSGKTTWMAELVRISLTSPAFSPLFRIVVFDVKNEGYGSLAEPVSDWRGFERSIKRNRLTVIHPPDLESAQGFLDDVIAHLFNLSKRLDDFGATLILEESSTFIRSTPNGVPPSLKRMATQGRSMSLSLVLLNQRALSSKWVDTQTNSMVIFRLPIPDLDLVNRRWGFDMMTVDERLRKERFSYAHFDLESLSINYYQPLQIQPTP